MRPDIRPDLRPDLRTDTRRTGGLLGALFVLCALVPAPLHASYEAPQQASQALPGVAQPGAELPRQGLPLPEQPGPDRIVPVERPEAIRGIYLNAWQSGSSVRTDNALALARRTEINTFVIDVKDATGYVSYNTGVGLAREVGADGEIRIRNLARLLEKMADEGVYPIARIVVFKDALLPESRPDLALQDSTGAAWVDGRGDRWVNPYHTDVWDYHIALAREAIELGFAEIQWDYIRFPDRPGSEMASVVFPHREGRSRPAIIRAFLEYSRAELADLEAPLTADVFGVATTVLTDVGIGQRWEDIVDVVDATLPMIYPSHYYRGSFGFDSPNAHPYEVVLGALESAVRRSAEVEGATRIIPWLQDFTLGAPPYGADQVRAQIQATYDAGLDEWILWNASGRYTEAALEPAPIEPEPIEPAPLEPTPELAPEGPARPGSPEG